MKNSNAIAIKKRRIAPSLKSVNVVAAPLKLVESAGKTSAARSIANAIRTNRETSVPLNGGANHATPAQRARSKKKRRDVANDANSNPEIATVALFP